MKLTLFAVALVASQLCTAQRFREITNGSWNHQNLSVETKGDLVISGFTEPGPSGRLTPTFKLNSLAGAPGPSYHINYPDDVYLMDFQIRPSTTTLVFVGMVAAVGTTPYKMVVAEWNYSTNTMVQNTIQNNPNNMIPHQVVISETAGQVVLVGSRISGAITTANFSNLPKSGFVLALNLANFNFVSFAQEMNTPLTGTTDNDILETITEVPGTGATAGYFIAGSANGMGNEQNVFTMGVNYGGAITHSRIVDNTNSRGAGASVMYSTLTVPASVYLLVNSSSMHQFQIARCNPATGAFIGANWINHQITSLPIAAGVDQNGFRLAQSVNPGQIFVGGYLSAPLGALPQLITPFQMTLNPGLGFIAGKYYQSGNNAPLAGYFEERGNSVYINTPDMLTFNQTSARMYLVNQNSVNNGFDLSVSTPLGNTGCERPFPVMTGTQPVIIVGSGTFNVLPITPSTYIPSPITRAVSQSVLCQQFAVVSSPEIWPNPATDQVQLALSDGETIQSVTVYDVNGKVVIENAAPEKTRGEMTLDISALTNGVYLIHITDINGIVHRDKFVKE